MPTHLLLRTAFQMIDDDPKNQCVINPCFRRSMDITDPTSGTDALQLCTDLANAMNTWMGSQTPPRSAMTTVKAYNLEQAKPNPPMASYVKNPLNYFTPSIPPEVAVCLSFYGGQNVPRNRGRLYIPGFCAGVSSSAVGLTVPSQVITNVEGLASVFSSLGGINVDWIVWSRAGHKASKVDHYWVDNAWDIQRRRGIPATTKPTVKTTSG